MPKTLDKKEDKKEDDEGGGGESEAAGGEGGSQEAPSDGAAQEPAEEPSYTVEIPTAIDPDFVAKESGGQEDFDPLKPIVDIEKK